MHSYQKCIHILSLRALIQIKLTFKLTYTISAWINTVVFITLVQKIDVLTIQT